MTAAIVLADNCLLVNLAHINRLDVLRDLVGDKLAWTQQVEHETSLSTKYVPALGGAYQFMPPALVPDARERQDTFAIRSLFAKPGELEPTLHLGEAETCAVIHTRFAATRTVFVATEDNSAALYVNRQGWRLLTTKNVLELGVRKGMLKLNEANEELRSLYTMPRGVRGFPPEIA